MEKSGGCIKENPKLYKVDGEVGRLSFKTHSVAIENKNVFNTSKDMFRILYSDEWYRTIGFNEITTKLVSNCSYRESAKTLNRMRNEKEGTPSRTLPSIVKQEASKIEDYLDKKVSDILYDNNFDEMSMPKDQRTINYFNTCSGKPYLKSSVLEKEIEKYNRDRNKEVQIPLHEKYNLYEVKQYSTNVCVDDVSVKKQKETREKSTIKQKKEKVNYIRNSIVHIKKNDKKYTLNSSSISKIIPIIVAFLLNNDCLHDSLTFFVDGERSLQSSLIDTFRWKKSFRLVLDWYHLVKKCEMELSSALNKRDKRNELLLMVKEQLWVGKIDTAIDLIRNIDEDIIKSKDKLERLIGYFERNRSYIPCYALRKAVGLCISSNQGEKANDLIVASRQKHNGMGWSKKGSLSLATITNIQRNSETLHWYEKGKIEFKLVS